jgi:hypothetical protein
MANLRKAVSGQRPAKIDGGDDPSSSAVNAGIRFKILFGRLLTADC